MLFGIVMIVVGVFIEVVGVCLIYVVVVVFFGVGGFVVFVFLCGIIVEVEVVC